MLAAINLAVARLRMGDLDAARPALVPVLALPPGKRTDPLPQRLETVRAELASSRYQLTVVRRIDPSAIHGFGYLFNWRRPSVLHGVHIVAWDIFFGLALLFAAPGIPHGGAGGRPQRAAARRRDVPGGRHRPSRQPHCPAPDRDHRHAIVWPIVGIPLSKAFRQAGPPAAAIMPAPGPDAEHAPQSTDQQRLHRS